MESSIGLRAYCIHLSWNQVCILTSFNQELGVLTMHYFFINQAKVNLLIYRLRISKYQNHFQSKNSNTFCYEKLLHNVYLQNTQIMITAKLPNTNPNHNKVNSKMNLAN